MKADYRLVQLPLRIPAATKGKLERISKARQLGTPSALARLYISEGIARDELLLQQQVLNLRPVQSMLDALREHGVEEEILDAALSRAVEAMV